MQQQGASDGRFCFAGWKARHFLHVSCTPGCTACWFSFVFPLHQPPCPDAAALPNRFVLFHCVFLQVRRVRASAGLAGAASSKAFLGRRASINPHLQPCRLHHQTHSLARKSLPAPYIFWSAQTRSQHLLSRGVSIDLALLPLSRIPPLPPSPWTSRCSSSSCLPEP